MKKLKLYEQFDLDDLSEDDIFGKNDEPEVGDLIEVLPTLERYII